MQEFTKTFGIIEEVDLLKAAPEVGKAVDEMLSEVAIHNLNVEAVMKEA